MPFSDRKKDNGRLIKLKFEFKNDNVFKLPTPVLRNKSISQTTIKNKTTLLLLKKKTLMSVKKT